MLCEEKTASTDPEGTADMSVVLPTTSGATDGSMSRRNSRTITPALLLCALYVLVMRLTAKPASSN